MTIWLRLHNICSLQLPVERVVLPSLQPVSVGQVKSKDAPCSDD